MRQLKTWKALVLGVVTVGAIGAGVAKERGALTHAQSADHRLKYQLDWPRGEKLTYAIEWRGASEASIAAGGAGTPADKPKGLQGSVELDADLVIESYGVQAGSYLLREHLENVRRHDLRVLGANVLPTDDAARTAFEGRSVMVAMDGAGTVRGMYFSPGEDTLFAHVMQSVVTQTTMTFTPNGDAAWDAVETTLAGTANVRYRVTDVTPPQVERDRVSYTQLAAAPGRTPTARDTKLSATTLLKLEPNGHRVASLVDDEDVALRDATDPTMRIFASHTRFEMSLRDVSTFDASQAPPALARMDQRKPGDLVVSGHADEQIKAQRIAGLTGEELRNTVLAYASNPGDPDLKFMSRAAAYLAAHPEACLDMVALFESPAMNVKGREHVLELLASAGTPEAQEAMRTALESPTAHTDPRGWEQMVQRFTIVQRPTTDSIQFIAATYRDAREEGGRAASAYALGASVGKLAKMGSDPGVVHAAEADLLKGLRAAKAPTERRDMLGALGNLGLRENEATIASFAKDNSPSVRGAAAWALRKIDDEDARTALIGVAADPSPTVATSAYQAIGYQTMTNDDWQSLARVVVAGGTPAQSDPDLVNLLSRNPSGGPAIVQMLEAVAARNASDNSLLARIRHAIQNIQSMQ